MTPTIGASRVATLVGDFDRSPAYAGLAEAIRHLLTDGRLPVDARLPSERELTAALAVSRTTVTRAYAALVEAGYAEAHRGSGTFTRVPGGRARTHDRALLPRAGDADAIDLNCAAPVSPPGIQQAYEAAVADLPAYLSGHGYYPAGLPRLQQAIAAPYDARGLPTDPDQVMVTAGALSAASIVSAAFTAPGQRVLVETPVYPNATESLRHHGARLVGNPVDPDGWDLAVVAAGLRQHAPTLAYLIPDFQNPTGHLMPDEQREEYANHLRRARTVALVDEAHQALPLEGQGMPRPFASYAADTITLGSASKPYWGGLRLGWIRAPHPMMDRLTRARISLDLGAPVLEQLVLAHLLEGGSAVLDHHRARLREQRDVLAAAISARLPEWRFRLPGGGLALWCELPADRAVELVTEAERRGVIVAPGPVFAVEGGLNRYVRVPWTRSVAELELAVDRLAEAWAAVSQGRVSVPSRSRVMVA